MSDDWQSLAQDFASLVRSAQILPMVHKPFGTTRPLERSAPVPQLPHQEPVKPPISKAVAQRVEDILTDVLQRVVKRCGIALGTREARLIEQLIEKQAANLVAAAKVKRTAEKIKADEKAKRKQLADDLRSGRKRLRQLDDAIFRRRHLDYEYPPIPEPTHEPRRDGSGLPESAGIYFLWNGGTIEYVGQAIKLSNRLKLGSHHVLAAHHRISFVLLERKHLTWAECYYIGIMRPIKNFGTKAAHNKFYDE